MGSPGAGLPGGYVVAKDLTIFNSTTQGNAYCRYNTETGERKYCSKALYQDADEKFVIPEDDSVPRPLIQCGCCGNDSYRTEDDSCGSCGKPVFDCPACEGEVHGKADNCPHCGQKYKW